MVDDVWKNFGKKMQRRSTVPTGLRGELLDSPTHAEARG
jgi:hypothetical protein